jgi:carbamoyltransferase
MWGMVNKIKGREWWRPLAPSLIDARRYFVGGKPHEFMLMMYRFLADAAERVPAVCHVDGTARPQTVDNVNNPVWRNLIGSFEDLTGEAMVVNTSFNLAGEPIVETPQDALRSFAVGGLDALYLQGQLIMKS